MPLIATDPNDLDPLWRLPWRAADRMRQALARSLDAAGPGTDRTPVAEVIDLRVGTLKSYAPAAQGRAALLVPAPIKRSYIWDLSPDASPVRRLLEGGHSVFLLEWPDADAADPGPFGVDLLERAVAAVAERTGHPPALVGHSLGGTLAAIFAARRPEAISALVPVDTAIAFDEESGPLARAVKRFPWAAPRHGAPYPGTLMSVQGAMAVPEEFVFARVADAMASAGDRDAAALHWRVVRWSLDEYAMPASLFSDVVGRLFRDDAFSRGRLEIGGARVGPAAISVPILAVVDRLSRVAPPASLLRPLELSGNAPARVLWYGGDRGTVFRHVGALVGPTAQREIWPRVAAWLNQA